MGIYIVILLWSRTYLFITVDTAGLNLPAMWIAQFIFINLAVSMVPALDAETSYIPAGVSVIFIGTDTKPI